MKTLTRTIAAIASVPIAGIIAFTGASSAFAISCPAGYVSAVAGNGAEFCSPTGTGGVGGGGSTTIGGGGSTVPGQAGTIVGGGNTAPVAPAPAPVYNPPPAYVAPAPAPAPAPVPARQVAAPAAPANSVEPPSGSSEIPAAVTLDTAPVSEPSKPAVETPSETPSAAPSAHPSSAESSAPVNTASAIPSSSVETPAPEVSVTPVVLSQASSASPLNFSVTAGAGLIAFILLAMTVAGRISFARAGANKINDSESAAD